MRLATLAVIGVLGLVRSVHAEPPNARAVLQQAETAIRALHAVRYEGRGEVEGPLANQIPRMSGTVTQIAIPDAGLPRIRIDGEVIAPRQAQGVRLEIANDGKTVTLREHARKLFVRRELPSGASVLTTARALFIPELTAPRPFERESQAQSLEYVRTEMVGDVECDVIYAILGADGSGVRWSIGKADHLPRRVQRILPSVGGQSTITTTLSSVNLQPEVTEDLFRLERTAEFNEVGPNGLLQVGGAAPDWTLTGADGREVSLQGLRGKVVLLDFWATWCMPCRQAMPGIQRLYNKYKDKPVAIFGVNCKENNPKADAAAVMKAANSTYPLLLKGDAVADKYLVQGIPAFYLIDRDGQILMAQAGLSPTGEQAIDQMIEKHLATSQPTSGTAP